MFQERVREISIQAAAGSIGQFVGQIAKIKGLRVVFLLNLMRKLLNKLKFDVAFNYKKVDFDKELSKHCPNCIDILFDNVGDCEKDLAEWVRTGKIIYKVNIYVGIENVAKGFVNMLSGKNICKAVVKY
ncbi:hypothetical protein RhiirA4_424593 [Rhizophagus irregularis]|uniref:Alcohol dehydrogenase-like C-terminal domain-containing protein n=1 Tax=Rhizophagus irregularis TaxID=588596 RepID=A0A2I1GNY6_9GLOM|nr:hypothetical protein RhiirA4_422056 [Rhizophagus irregularis]PKY51544.1 hypothetical protein RhiirA4_424593 [Rhizophagus irregularis]